MKRMISPEAARISSMTRFIALFEFAAILRTGNEAGEIERDDATVGVGVPALRP